MKSQPQSVIVTGASLGLGRAIAEAFVRDGHDVLLCARTPGPLKEAALELQKLAVPGRKVLWKTCDVSEPAHVKRLFAHAVRHFGGCDVLVNNAGIHGAKGPLEEVSWAEWQRTIEINLYGVVLPCRAAIPLMRQKGRGKIINISGGGATGPRPFFSAYAAAKAAVVRLTETLAEELRPAHIDVNAIAPGALNTRLTVDALAAGPGKIGAQAYADMLRVQEGNANSPDIAAKLCVLLASRKSDGITGKLISAPWDPWQNLDDHRADLAATDIYTLRRIVPKDRGRKWGDQ